jgi:hypothetical protein
VVVAVRAAEVEKARAAAVGAGAVTVAARVAAVVATVGVATRVTARVAEARLVVEEAMVAVTRSRLQHNYSLRKHR